MTNAVTLVVVSLIKTIFGKANDKNIIETYSTNNTRIKYISFFFTTTVRKKIPNINKNKPPPLTPARHKKIAGIMIKQIITVTISPYV